MSYSIRGNEIVFRNTNSANPSDIKLKHENANNQLVFNSEVTSRHIKHNNNTWTLPNSIK
jgi:hypothetical protein